MKRAKDMKSIKTILTFVVAVSGGAIISLAQEASSKTPTKEQQVASASTRFDLDFPGGTPEQLIRAIEKQSGKPVNALIPEENAAVKLPALKLRNITLPQIFGALQQSSMKSVPLPNGTRLIRFGFRTLGGEEPSIWYFIEESLGETRFGEKICRYYQLAPYLEAYSIEDITTAVQTGWKMLGDMNPPKLSFHKETKLLIAVGEPERLGLIDSVLAEFNKLSTRPSKSAAPMAGGKNKSAEEPKL